jgi:hypothetical protein
VLVVAKGILQSSYNDIILGEQKRIGTLKAIFERLRKHLLQGWNPGAD